MEMFLSLEGFYEGYLQFINGTMDHTIAQKFEGYKYSIQKIMTCKV